MLKASHPCGNVFVTDLKQLRNEVKISRYT